MVNKFSFTVEAEIEGRRFMAQGAVEDDPGSGGDPEDPPPENQTDPGDPGSGGDPEDPPPAIQ